MKARILSTIIILLLITNVFSQTKRDINWKQDLDYLKNYLEIVHPALHAYLAEAVFNEKFNYIRDNCETLDDTEIITRIAEIFAMIQDGHTGIDIGNKENKYIAGIFHKYPLLLYKFSDGLFAIWAKNEYSEIVGKKLLRIGNLKADEALEQMMRLNIGDNIMGRIQYLPLIQEYLQYTGVMDKSSDLLKLVYEDETGKESYLELKNPKSMLDAYMPPRIFGLNDSLVTAMNDDSKSPLPLYLSHIGEEFGGFPYTGEFYWYEYIPEQEAIYMQISVNVQKGDDPFDAFCKRMFNDLDSLQAKKLIVDVRLNSGGNHFEMPLIKGIIERPQIDTKGNLFLITGRRTISASEHLTTQMETYTNATIFGEPTSARPNMVGSITPFTLPTSKLKCRTAKEYTQDSEYFDGRIMTKPAVYALLSSEDYKNNFDPVLSKIFMYPTILKAKEKLRIALQEGYHKDRITGLQTAFNKNKKECVELGVNFESFLYDDFRLWVWYNKKEDADYLEYVKFLVEEVLPNSVIVNYGYAFGAFIGDKNEEAKKYFKKCLELNPAHSNAIKYFNLLKFNESVDYEVENYGW